jgi:hypothetical protein
MYVPRRLGGKRSFDCQPRFMAGQEIGHLFTALFEEEDKVKRLANHPIVGLSDDAFPLREQVEVPVDQIITREHEKDRAA